MSYDPRHGDVNNEVCRFHFCRQFLAVDDELKSLAFAASFDVPNSNCFIFLKRISSKIEVVPGVAKSLLIHGGLEIIAVMFSAI